MIAAESTSKSRDSMVAERVLEWPERQVAPTAVRASRLQHRVSQVAAHISWYGFKTQARLAQDSGVSPAAISRLIRGQSQPSLALALRVTGALSKRAGHTLDVGEVFSLDGTYSIPTCALMGCRACVTPQTYGGADKENQREGTDSKDRKGGA